MSWSLRTNSLVMAVGEKTPVLTMPDAILGNILVIIQKSTNRGLTVLMASLIKLPSVKIRKEKWLEEIKSLFGISLMARSSVKLPLLTLNREA